MQYAIKRDECLKRMNEKKKKNDKNVLLCLLNHPEYLSPYCLFVIQRWTWSKCTSPVSMFSVLFKLKLKFLLWFVSVCGSLWAKLREVCQGHQSCLHSQLTVSKLPHFSFDVPAVLKIKKYFCSSFFQTSFFQEWFVCWWWVGVGGCWFADDQFPCLCVSVWIWKCE